MMYEVSNRDAACSSQYILELRGTIRSFFADGIILRKEFLVSFAHSQN